MSDAEKTVSSQTATTKYCRLKESVVKKALEDLDWNGLKDHLNDAGMEDGALEFILGHLRRTTSLIMPYPDEKREAQRADFIRCLTEYIFMMLGEEATVSVSKEVALLYRIERGYRGILEILDQCEISNFSSDVRVAAYISRAAYQYAHVIREFYEALEARKEIGPHGPLLMSEDLAQVSPDQVITAIVETLTISVVMEAYKNKWFDSDGCVVLPPLPEIGDKERYKAGSTELLGIWWQRWRRTEERRRFLGGTFEEYAAPNIPAWAPTKAQNVIVYNPLKIELFDYISNERLNDRILQTFMEMLIETNTESNTKGILKGAPLLPDAFVSTEEVHSAVTMSEILSYDITQDQEQPAGIRLVEWLRGYTVLKELVRQRSGTGSEVASLVFEISRAELSTLMYKNGMHKDSASIFLDTVTLKRTSRDLFDSPLVKLKEGTLLVFSPGLISINLVRVILSTIANHGEPLARKGKAFERYILSFFEKKKLLANSLKFSVDGEEYEYDVILSWGDYIFVFECKNHSLSNNNPIKAYYFEMERRSNAKQVKRLAKGLQLYPDRVKELLGLDVTTKRIIPCVLNSLPFSLPGKIEGVYFTDASTLKRFFQERYFHIKSPHRISDNIQVLHRTATHSLWTGDEPCPEDLIRQFENPFQLKLMLAHVQTISRPFGIGTHDFVAAGEFFRTEISIESYSDIVGVSSKTIRAEMDKVKRYVKEISDKQE